MLRCASEVVREERRDARRRETRTELIGQLQEAEATEAKDRLKVSLTIVAGVTNVIL